jgi:hypothetical protein
MSKAIKILAAAFAAAAFAAPLAQADAYRAADRGRAHAVSRMNPLKMGDVSRMNPWASRNAIGRMVPKAHLRASSGCCPARAAARP